MPTDDQGSPTPPTTPPAGAPLTSKAPGFQTPRRRTTPSRPSPPPTTPTRDDQRTPEPPPPTPAPRGLLGRMRGGGADRRTAGVRRSIPGTTSSPISTDTVRNISNAVYVIVRGGTRLGDKLLGKRFPQLHLAASANEARDIARPLARLAARRVDWTGDTNDAMDALVLFFGLAGYIGARTGLDLDAPEASDGFDGELYRQIEDEVSADRKRRSPIVTASTGDVAPPPAASTPTPAGVPARAPAAGPPQRPPGDGPVLLADALGGPPPDDSWRAADV
jgi:hypothetical protein